MDKEYPYVETFIRVYPARSFTRLLAEYPADIVLSSSKLDTPGYIAIDQFDEPLCLLASDSALPNNRISLEELSEQPLLLRETSSSIRKIIEDLFC